MGSVQKAVGRTPFFIALKHGADTFFAVFSHVSDTFFHCLEANEKIFTEKCSCSYIFHWIADSDWSAVAPIEMNWKKKKLTPRAASAANTMSSNIFWRQYLWKEYDLPQYKIFCLIVWENVRMSWARTFFLAVSQGANTFFHRFLPCGIICFHTIIYICTGPMPQ